MMPYSFSPLPKFQRGLATMTVAILLLLILSIIVVMSTAGTVFETRSARNEHRAKMVQQLSETALNVSLEYVKASAAVMTSPFEDGWLHPDSLRWQPCTSTAPAGSDDPCLAVPESPNIQQAALYRYTFGGSTTLDITSLFPDAVLPDTLSLGGASTGIETTVSAVLCRFDIQDPEDPVCSLDPTVPGMVAITLVSTARIPGEDAVAQTKESVGTFRVIGGAVPVPLFAASTVMGLGSAEIVASPNGGGFGLPVSIWSPCPVQIGGIGGSIGDTACPINTGGVGSVATCHLGDFLGSVPRENLFTTCATTNECGCPNDPKISLSGAFAGGVRSKNVDILDISGNTGALPDITYFPREPYDDPTDPLDDSVFEMVFAQDVVPEGELHVAQNCGSGTEDCAKVALESLSPEILPTVASCDTLNANSSGLYWAQNGCEINGGTIGSPERPVVLVVEDDMHVRGNFVFYGILFVRSSTMSATFRGNGGAKLFGMTMVEGTVGINGGVQFIYSDTIRNNINTSPDFVRFGRVSGTWFDSGTAF